MKRKNKYGRKKTTVDGIEFDSKGEARRYEQLKLLQKAGEISDLELQVKYTLQEGFRYDGKAVRAITYTADFKYTENRKTVVEDFKGMRTEAFNIKWKMLQYKLRDTDIVLRLTKG